VYANAYIFARFQSVADVFETRWSTLLTDEARGRSVFRNTRERTLGVWVALRRRGRHFCVRVLVLRTRLTLLRARDAFTTARRGATYD